MTKRNALIVGAVGVLVILFALLANTIGIGNSGFGIKHVAVLVFGIILLVVGAVIAWRAKAAGAGAASPPSKTA